LNVEVPWDKVFTDLNLSTWGALDRFLSCGGLKGTVGRTVGQAVLPARDFLGVCRGRPSAANEVQGSGASGSISSRSVNSSPWLCTENSSESAPVTPAPGIVTVYSVYGVGFGILGPAQPGPQL
jgi:hypothetical protein